VCRVHDPVPIYNTHSELTTHIPRALLSVLLSFANMSKAKPKIAHVELTAHRPLSQTEDGYSQRCGERNTNSRKCPPTRGFRKFGCINTWAVCLNKAFGDFILCVGGFQGNKTCSGQRELRAGETEEEKGGKQQLGEETLVSHRRFVTASLKNTGL